MIDIKLTTAQKVKFRKLYDSVVTIGDYMDMFKNGGLTYSEANQYIRLLNSGWPQREGPFRTVGKLDLPEGYYEKQILTQATKDVNEKNEPLDIRLLTGNHVSAEKGYDLSYLRDQLEQQFGLTECEVGLHDQPPGAVHGWHFDSMYNYYTKVWLPKDPARANLPFNKELQWVDDGTCPQRMFLTLTDWCYGQVFGFGTQQWSDWKKGEVTWFEWQNLPHYTANASLFDRPIVRVTGLTSLSDLRYSRA